MLRIIRSKISDSAILSDNGENLALMFYQWTTLLKSLEAYDVYMNINKRQLDKGNIFRLLISNPLFPRSIQYSGDKIKRHFENISARPDGYAEALNDYDVAVTECMRFKDFDEDEKVVSYVDQAFSCISNFHFNIDKLYFQ